MSPRTDKTPIFIFQMREMSKEKNTKKSGGLGGGVRKQTNSRQTTGQHKAYICREMRDRETTQNTVQSSRHHAYRVSNDCRVSRIHRVHHFASLPLSFPHHSPRPFSFPSFSTIDLCCIRVPILISNSCAIGVVWAQSVFSFSLLFSTPLHSTPLSDSLARRVVCHTHAHAHTPSFTLRPYL